MGDVNLSPPAETASSTARWVTIAVLVLVHLALASALALLPFEKRGYPNRPVIGLVLGLIFGQVSLSASWCALGPGKFVLRVPLSLMAACLAGLAMAAYIHKSSPNAEDFWMLVGLTLLGWSLLQSVLWPISVGGRMKRFVCLPNESRNHARSQFTLADMLRWTLGIALLLGIGRLALRDLQVSTSRGLRTEDIIIFLLLLVGNFALAIPLILAVLGLRSTTYRVLIVVVWSLVLGTLESFGLMLITGFSIESDSIVLFLLMNIVHGSVLGGSLFALTAVGYRLRRLEAVSGQIPHNASKD